MKMLGSGWRSGWRSAWRSAWIVILLVGLAVPARARGPIFPDAEAVLASINTVCKLVSQRYDKPIAVVRAIGIRPGPDDGVGPTYRVTAELKLPFEVADTLIEALAGNNQVDLGRSSMTLTALPERIQIPDVQGTLLDVAQVAWTLDITVCPHGNNETRQNRKDMWAALRLALTTRRDRFADGRLATLRKVEMDRHLLAVEVAARDYIALRTAALRFAGLESRGAVSFDPCFGWTQVARVESEPASPHAILAAQFRAGLDSPVKPRVPYGLEALNAIFVAANGVQPALGLAPNAPPAVETVHVRSAFNKKYPAAVTVDLRMHGYLEALGDSLEQAFGHPAVSLDGGSVSVALTPIDVTVQSGTARRSLGVVRVHAQYTFGVPPTTPNRAERLQELMRALAGSLTGSRAAFLAGQRPALFSELEVGPDSGVMLKITTMTAGAVAKVMDDLGDEPTARLSGLRPVRIQSATLAGKTVLITELAATHSIGVLARRPRGIAALRKLEELVAAQKDGELAQATFPTHIVPGRPIAVQLETRLPRAGTHVARAWNKTTVTLPGAGPDDEDMP